MQTKPMPSVCSCCRSGGYQHRLTCEALRIATSETHTGKIIERCAKCLANLHDDAPYYTINGMPGRYCIYCYTDMRPVYATTYSAISCISCGDSLLVGEVCYKFPNGKGHYCKKCYGDNIRTRGKEPDYESNKVNPITLQSASEHFTPKHYGGDNIELDPDKFIHLHKLNFRIGNVIKYVTRAGKKPGIPRIEDLRKALDYLQREIAAE